MRKTLGVRTMARASATRWRWPPESSLGSRAEQAVELDPLGHLADDPVPLGLRHLPDLQRVADVVLDREVRIERVGLEDHRHVAIFRQHVVDAPVGDIDVALGDLLETGDHAHGRRLAAAGGTEEDEKLLVLDLEIEIADGDEIPEFLGDAIEAYIGHAGMP